MGRKKLPKEKRYKEQVKTFVSRYGREGYALAGSEGGKKSPTKFTSETASRASKISWEKRRARQAAEGKKADENRSKASEQEEQS